jgi:hypothetical protein
MTSEKLDFGTIESKDTTKARKVHFSESGPDKDAISTGPINSKEYEPLDEALDFNTSKAACTPSINRIQYRNPDERASVTAILAPPSSLVRPNYEDILRRVSVVIHQHISKCEARISSVPASHHEKDTTEASKLQVFSEENFISPQYVYHFVRSPICRLGFLYGIRKVTKICSVPTLSEVHTFLRDLFVKAQLSAECSIG